MPQGGDHEGDITPFELLDDLSQIAGTQEMIDKLDLLVSGLRQWEAEGPSRELCQHVRKRITAPFQVKGTEAVACALWAMCSHWEV